MERWLRGWGFYVGFGLLIGGLYLRALSVKPSTQLRVVQAPPQESVLEWWPKDLGPSAFARAAARAPAAAAALSMLTLLMAGAGIGGVVLTLRALVTGRIREIWRFTAPGGAGPPAWTFGELTRIIFLTVMVALLLPFLRPAFFPPAPDGRIDAHLWITVSMCALDAFLIVAILAFASGKAATLWRAFGVSRGELIPRIAAALRAYLTVFPWLFLLLFLVVEGARAVGLKPPVEPIQQLIFGERRPLVLALTVVLGCVIGPLAEELFFRGVVYTAIRRRLPRAAAIMASGAAFSILHTNPLGFLPITALGCLLAYLYERTGSLISPLVVHVAHNTLLLSLALLVKRLMTD